MACPSKTRAPSLHRRRARIPRRCRGYTAIRCATIFAAASGARGRLCSRRERRRYSSTTSRALPGGLARSSAAWGEALRRPGAADGRSAHARADAELVRLRRPVERARRGDRTEAMGADLPAPQRCDLPGGLAPQSRADAVPITSSCSKTAASKPKARGRLLRHRLHVPRAVVRGRPQGLDFSLIPSDK